VRALVRILEASPPADVIDQDRVKIGCSATHVRDQLPERFATFEAKSALTAVLISSDNLKNRDARHTPQ
jgi:hypothetical protein